tara:strand:+ start:603 stop:953 length:351 start_codon:yes stop_codon:yes gene_type:complete
MIYLLLIFSMLVNILLGWYIAKLLRKFIFISQNMSDLMLTVKSFRIFIKNLYSMDSYHGEPMIQEIILRIGQVSNEIENFRDIFEHTIDQELEEELDDAEEEAQGQEKEPLFHESP